MTPAAPGGNLACVSESPRLPAACGSSRTNRVADAGTPRRLAPANCPTIEDPLADDHASMLTSTTLESPHATGSNYAAAVIEFRDARHLSRCLNRSRKRGPAQGPPLCVTTTPYLF